MNRYYFILVLLALAFLINGCMDSEPSSSSAPENVSQAFPGYANIVKDCAIADVAGADTPKNKEYFCAATKYSDLEAYRQNLANKHGYSDTLRYAVKLTPSQGGIVTAEYSFNDTGLTTKYLNASNYTTGCFLVKLSVD